MGDVLKRLNEIERVLDEKKLAKVAYAAFLENTPQKTGQAKRSTTLSNDTITAGYRYAGVLDAGRGYRDGQMRGSDQAPKGMMKPTIAAILEYIKQELK